MRPSPAASTLTVTLQQPQLPFEINCCWCSRLWSAIARPWFPSRALRLQGEVSGVAGCLFLAVVRDESVASDGFRRRYPNLIARSVMLLSA